MAASNNISIKDIKEMSEADRKKISKDRLLQVILNSNVNDDTSGLTVAVNELKLLLQVYKREVEENSKSIVELKVEVETLKNEKRVFENDMSARINSLEQRSRIKNLEIVGLRKPNEQDESETDKSLSINFLNTIMWANVDESDLDVVH